MATGKWLVLERTKYRPMNKTGLSFMGFTLANQKFKADEKKITHFLPWGHRDSRRVNGV